MFEQRTPLHVAARLGMDAIVAILLKDPKVDTMCGDANGMRAIHIAATHDHHGTLSQLLDHAGPSGTAATTTAVNALDAFGWSALHWTAFNGSLTCAQRLLEGGANTSAKGVSVRVHINTTNCSISRSSLWKQGCGGSFSLEVYKHL